MPDFDPELAAVLRASSEARIRQQIADAAERRQGQQDARDDFNTRRRYAKQQMHATRARLIHRHQQKEQ